MFSISIKKGVFNIIIAISLLFIILSLQSCTDSGEKTATPGETTQDKTETAVTETPDITQSETASPLQSETPQTSPADTSALPTKEPISETPAPTGGETVTPEATGTKGENTQNITVKKTNSTEDVKNEDEIVVGSVNYSIPALSSDNSLLQTTIATIENSVTEEINALKEKYKTRILFYSLDSDPQSEDKYYYTISFTSYLSEDYISFKVTSVYEYASQTDVSSEAYVYSLKSGKKLEVADLGLSTRTLAEEAIDATVGMRIDFADDYRETIREKICSSFYIDGENIILIYDECIIAPEIYGSIELSVPLKNVII